MRRFKLIDKTNYQYSFKTIDQILDLLNANRSNEWTPFTKEDNLEQALKEFTDFELMESLDENEDEEEESIEFMCPECYEWTSSDEPCCGVGPSRYNEDSLNDER